MKPNYEPETCALVAIAWWCFVAAALAFLVWLLVDGFSVAL